MKDGTSDYLLIDCPPNFNIVTQTAIVASDYLLVPTKPDYLSTLGIEELTKHLGAMVTTYNKHVNDSDNSEWVPITPRILGVLFTMIQFYGQQPISTQQQYIEQVRLLKIPLLDTPVRENKTMYASAPEYGVPVVLKAVYGQTQQNIRDELERLTSEVLAKLAI